MMLESEHFSDTGTLYSFLWARRHAIEELTAHHLRLGRGSTCIVAPQSIWKRTASYVEVPVDVWYHQDPLDGSKRERRLLMRCPVPSSVNETRYPGALCDKISVEAGNHIWLTKHCPELRLPRLFGFGYPSGHHYTHVSNRPWIQQLFIVIWRLIATFFKLSMVSDYAYTPFRANIPTGYLLVEQAGPSIGTRLSDLDEPYHRNPVLQRNIFRGVALLLLHLARLPQIKIGSYRFNLNGSVAPGSRPLANVYTELERDQGKRVVQPHETYMSATDFVTDLLEAHNESLAIRSESMSKSKEDYAGLGPRSLLQTLSHRFSSAQFRQGPFLMQVANLKPENILVDEFCNIRGFIGLEELICSLPAEMLQVPAWLVNSENMDMFSDSLEKNGVSNEDGEDNDRRHFLCIMCELESQMGPGHVHFEHDISPTSMVRQSWVSGASWFYEACMSTPADLYDLLIHRICSRPNHELPYALEKSFQVEAINEKDGKMEH